MMKRLLGLLALLLLSVASAQIVVSPQAIVVNPRPSFGVEVWLDRDTSGDGSPSYAIGEEVRISVRATERSYVYVFDVNPSGSRYQFNIAPPRGLSKVIAIASKGQLDTRQLARFQDEDDLFASGSGGEESFVQGFSIIVNPIPQQDWVTDTALYYVGNRPPQAQFGTLRLQTTPRGAEAYVDGEFVGYTPLDFGTRPGNHDVRFELGGYDAYATTVNLRGDQTLTVSANLQQQVRAGTASFSSSPSGADVYVNGNYVGTTPTGSIRFEEGSYQARFELPGYQSTVTTFQVTPGRDRSVDVSMRSMQSTVVVQANVGGAWVFIDGSQVGTIPNGTGRLQVSNVQPGTHELVVIAPGFATYVTTFNAQGGGTVELNVRQSRFR